MRDQGEIEIVAQGEEGEGKIKSVVGIHVGTWVLD
jgi:hypothetical protein